MNFLQRTRGEETKSLERNESFITTNLACLNLLFTVHHRQTTICWSALICTSLNKQEYCLLCKYLYNFYQYIHTTKLVLSSKITSGLTDMTRSVKSESLQQRHVPFVPCHWEYHWEQRYRYIHNLNNELIINLVVLSYIDLNNDLVNNKIDCFWYTYVHIYNYDLMITSKWNR